MPDIGEADLLEAIVQRKDREAFAELFRRFEIPAFRLAQHLTNRRELAEEAVQEAMLAVWFGAESFQPGSSVRKWILGIVAHRALKAARKDRKRHKDMDWERERRAARPDEPAPGAEAEEHELLGRLRGMLGALPEIERQLVALYYGAGLTQEEIGEALALPQRTVSAKLKGSLDRLRKSLAGAGLAAAVPVLTDATLSDALSSGPKVPGGLLERTLARCEQPYAPRLTSRRSGRAAGAGSKTGLVVAAALVALIAAGTYALRQQPESPSAMPDAAAPPASDTPLPPPAAPRKWSFDFQEMPGDGFEYVQGSWRWGTDKAGGKPCLIGQETKFPNVFMLPELGHRLPIKVTVYYHTSRTDPMQIGIGWTDGLQSFPARKWSGKGYTAWKGKSTDFFCYFIRNYTVGGSGAKLGTIGRDSEDVDRKRLYICGENIAIESVEIQELREEDIPVAYRDFDTLIKGREKDYTDMPAFQWGANYPKPLAQHLKETEQAKKP
ncbi:MAG: sigma-70 family RNA polymerase sigma factor [Planctomycetes bacterium]|nr:sigma-70 family RNA polymerase sigma factor [Planctomycetota bacterium]